ncbi:MAG: hypothetical protein KBI40_06400 [Firmicutes bacterium]|jgi:hypothetical protein|nr:hypothetical protein [Candidatus Fermentithermobacillaceae bacterium]
MNPVAIWIAAFFTIAVYSFLFGDNPVYRFTEHLFIGLTAANLTVQGFHNVKTQAWQPLITKGELMWLGVIIGGLMLLCRWFKQVEWVSRIPLQFMTGTAMALSVIRALDSEFFKQLISTVNLKWTNVNDAIYILCVILPICYLLYTMNQKRGAGIVVKHAGTIGQYLMMLAFGASLGSTIMARVSLVIERFQFLFGTWLKISG